MPENEKIVMYTTSWCSDCHRAKHLLNEFDIVYEEHDVDSDVTALEIVKGHNNGNRVVPTIVFSDGSILVEPSNKELADKVGVELDRGLI